MDSWGLIELVRDGRRLMSTDHGSAPSCSGIDQVFRFRLRPGHYTLEISDNRATVVQLMVIPD
jgi:hypothetical protein